jgi:putative two-component system response regulator
MPDHILRPSGALDSEDQIILQGHTTIGAETLKTVAKRDRSAAAFWQMAMDIARHHHEQFNGRGYPDGLSGNDIPLAARIVAVADAYETLRGPSPAGKHLTHVAVQEWILKGSPGRFDPLLLKAFGESETEFDNVFRSCPDDEDTLRAPAGEGSIPTQDQAGPFDATGLRICVEA